MISEPDKSAADAPHQGAVPGFETEQASAQNTAGDPEPVMAMAQAVAAIPISRFCNRCGAAWQEGWGDCHNCTRHATAQSLQLQLATPISPAPAIALYFTLLGTNLIGILSSVGGSSTESILVVLSIVDSIIVAVWAIVYRQDIFKALTQRVSMRWFIAAAGLSIVTFLLASGSLEVLRRTVGLQRIPIGDNLFHASYGWPAVIALTCIQPAVFEELGFRGVIFGVLGRSLSRGEVIFVSALLFMTLHLAVGAFPHLLVMGLLLGVLRDRSRSLLPGMLMHFLHNLMCILSERFHILV
ncbi:MAG TPA: type II CAAX endopeptidase family protein [Humisphaera sp.]|nr:type II CAAX endopeptidase family protein [Humisphaera sp.]